MSFRTQPRPRSKAGATGSLKPSRADPSSPWQGRAAKPAAHPYPQTPQHRRGATSGTPQGATAGDRGNPAPPTEGENLRPEEPPSTTNLQPAAAPSPARRQTLRDPALTSERHHPMTPTRTGPETCSNHDPPAQPTTPETPINQQATSPASAPAPARAPHANSPTKGQRHGPHPAAPQLQGSTLAQTLRGANGQATMA